LYIVTGKTLPRKKNSHIGQKAFNLVRLRRHFMVPEFAVISTQAYREYRESGRMPGSLEKELERTVGKLLKEGKIAVRSSGTAEDLAGVSFAGMYETALNIAKFEECLDAILRVWNSADSPRVREYCRKMNMQGGDMAVMLQHQLEPGVSGVMVTQSPFSISEVMIECCSGLGDKLVSGEVTPTRYRIRDGNVIEQRGTGLLTPEQLGELVENGQRIERLLGSAQDIEWAIEDSKLYILQSRPVFVRNATSRSRGTVWCNANVRETIPDPISPMIWSIFDTSFFPGIMIDVFGFPISREQYRKFRPVEMLSGRLYWNMNNTLMYGKPIGPLLDSISGDRAVDPQMATAFRAVDMENLPRIMSGRRMFVFSITALIRLCHYLMLSFIRYGWMRNKIARTNAELEEYCARFKTSAELATGIGNIKSWMDIVLKRFARRYFGGIFLGAFYLGILAGILSIRLGKKGEVIARRTITGIIDKTGEMALSINRLAQLAQQKVSTVSVSRLGKLYRRDAVFRASVDRFMSEFGHRGPAEFDVATPNWREDHEMLYRVVATARYSRHESRRAEMIKDMLNSVPPFERFVLRRFIPRLEFFVPLRENGKHYYLKATARTKDQLLVIGQRLVDDGFLLKQRDIFFLTLRDLDGIIDGRLTKKEVRNTVSQRKNQWHRYRLAVVPDIIYESGERVKDTVRKSNVIHGEPLSFGKVIARARVITDFSKIHRLKQGEILVTHHADPGWTPLFTVASGLVVEVGGVICHAAMVARELGLPALSAPGATELISDGAMIELDADEGTVILC
jgi:phosphohistidine swiveling domain-containing protein